MAGLPEDGYSHRPHMMTLEDLNSEFGNDWVEFVAGEGGFPKAIIKAQCGGRAEVYLHGGHITSWKTPNGRERLFCSSKAQFAPGKAIRGGIPIIFPQFGPGPITTHGFARNVSWQIVDAQFIDNRPSITLRLMADEVTKKIWPHDFQLDLEIFLSEVLEVTFTCVNTGTTPFPFQFAFHSYFTISDIGRVAIDGLSGLSYLDNLRAKAKSIEEAEQLKFNSEIDRIYLAAPNTLAIKDSKAKTAISIEKWNLPDAVAWNPWIEKSAGMSDLSPEDYKRFVCLECGAIGQAIEVAPKYHYAGGMIISTTDQ